MNKLSYLLMLLLMLCGCKSRARVVRQEQQLRALTELRDTLRIRWWSDGTVVEMPQLPHYPHTLRVEGDSILPSSGEAVVTRHSVLEAREEASQATQERQIAPTPATRPSRFLEGLWTGVGLMVVILLAIRLLRRYLKKGIW